MRHKKLKYSVLLHAWKQDTDLLLQATSLHWCSNKQWLSSYKERIPTQGVMMQYLSNFRHLFSWETEKHFISSLWPRGVRCRFGAAGLLRLGVWIPPRTWKSVYCECCVLSGRGLCDGLITRPRESYRVCVRVFFSLSATNARIKLYTYTENAGEVRLRRRRRKEGKRRIKERKKEGKKES